MPEKILLSWSGGKDSCLTLWQLQKTGNYEVAGLLSTITETYDRLSMHGVRRILIEQQAEALGLPLEWVSISSSATNEEYESRMSAALARHRQKGICTVAFGDLFLEDIRKYREDNLARIGMTGLFPLWKRDTAALARQFVQLGFKAVVVCIDSKALEQSFAGKAFDEDFLRQLPPSVDRCGENGEFHSFVFDGPLFRTAVRFTRGPVVARDSFCFCDLLPG